MPTRAEKFSGLSVAIVTPFRDGRIDYARLREQVDYKELLRTFPYGPPERELSLVKKARRSAR